MNPLLLSGYGISIEVNQARLTIKQKDDIIKFEPHRIPYDSIIVDGHYGSVSFEAMRWLSKHDVSIILLNWNGSILSSTFPKESNNGLLKIKQYEKYLDANTRVGIANKIINQKIQSSIGLLKELEKYYSIDLSTISKECETSHNNDLNRIMMHEGRIASAYWSQLSIIFNELAPEFNFQSRKNLSYSWNMNASDQINALLNYGYAILEGIIRKHINTIGLEPSIGFLHEIAPSKYPLVYDLQELFRYIIDLSVINILEKGLKKSDFITTENYHIRLKPETSKKLIEIIKEFSKYLLEKNRSFKFNIPEIVINRNDDLKTREKIKSITPDERKKLKINKSTLWYQQKKIKEGKPIKVYNKTKVRVQ